MLASQSVFVVDAHTTGTPIRVVTGGIPPLKGASVAEKMEDMRRNHDWLRTCIMQQPRGFLSLVGAILTEPCSPEADYGVFYIDALTYQPMCGAGTLSVAKALVETGMVKRVEPETKIVLETPTGLVAVYGKTTPSPASIWRTSRPSCTVRICTSTLPDTATFPWTSGMAATSSCWRTCIPSA